MKAATLSEIESAVADGGARLAALLELMSSEPSAGRASLELAASSLKPEVRAWVVGVATRVLGKHGQRLLQRLAADSADVVAVDALMQLGSLAPNLLKPHRDRVLGMLASDDPWGPVRATWLLVHLADDPRPEIREVLNRPKYPFHAIDAEVALRYLDLGEEALWDQLRSHRHDWTPALTRAAYQIRSEPALVALQHCAAEAPDEECRAICRHALDAWSDASAAPWDSQ